MHNANASTETRNATLGNADEGAESPEQVFLSAFNTLWESGVDKIASDLWASLVESWKAGDIAKLVSLDDLGLTRSETARCIVFVEDLGLHLHRLITSFFLTPKAFNTFRSDSLKKWEVYLRSRLLDPSFAFLLLQTLGAGLRLCELLLAPMARRSAFPESLNPAFFSFINLANFLAGSSRELKRAITALKALSKVAVDQLTKVTRPLLDIVTELPPTPSTSIISHPFIRTIYSPEHTFKQVSELRAYLVHALNDVGFKALHLQFINEVSATWRALSRSSSFRDLCAAVTSLWRSEHGSPKDKMTSFAKALNITNWELGRILSVNEEFSFNFSRLAMDFPSLIPTDVSFSHSPLASVESGKAVLPSSVTFLGMRIHIPQATYEIVRGGVLGFSDSGVANITIPFTLTLRITPDFKALPSLVDKVSITLTSSQPSSVPGVAKVWNAWLSAVVKAKIQEAIVERMEHSFTEWLNPLIDVPPPRSIPESPTDSTINIAIKSAVAAALAPQSATPAPPPRFTSPPVASPPSYPHSAVSQSNPLSQLEVHPSPTPDSLPPLSPITFPPPSQPPSAAKTPPAGGPLGARAAFLASLRMTSGISIRPLATGRDVLESLTNPFSGPNSSRADDDDDASSLGTGADARSRRVSIAVSTSRRGSTNVDSVMNLTRSRSTSHVIHDAIHDHHRRASHSHSHLRNLSFDAYPQVFESDEPETTSVPLTQDTTAPFPLPRSRASSTKSFRARTKSFMALSDMPSVAELAMGARLNGDGSTDVEEFEEASEELRKRLEDAFAGIDVPDVDLKGGSHKAFADGTEVDPTLAEGL